MGKKVQDGISIEFGYRVREKVKIVKMTLVKLIELVLRILSKRQIVAKRLRWGKIWVIMQDGEISLDFGWNRARKIFVLHFKIM